MHTYTTPFALRPLRSMLLLGLAATPLLGLAACGDDDAASDAPVETSATTDAPAATTAPAGSALQVVATDYQFAGLPAELAAGSYTLTFDNQGTEEHEIVLFKNPEGLAMEELAEMGPDEAMAHIEMAGVLFAGPGEAAAEELPLELTTGDYIATCFIPAATDGAPHFIHGMTQNIAVA